MLHAWSRLQHSPERLAVSALAAEVGVSRRCLELGFRREIGLPPRTVGRIARFQRVVHGLVQGWDLPRTAVECGYADQPHLTRDIREMAGVTPRELCAFLQYRELAPR